MYNVRMKTFRYLERVTKGIANHRRIEILSLLEKSPELSLSEVTDALGINLKTAGEHLRRLTIAGLVAKRNAGAAVRHIVTAEGRKALKFLRTLE